MKESVARSDTGEKKEYLNHSKKAKIETGQLVITALFTAIMCIFGPLALPIGPVPISLTNFVIYIAVFLLGTKLGTLSYVIYLLLGAVGLPVFSGFTGGLSKLVGPTGGYLFGFLPMAIILGACISKGAGKKWKFAIGMTIATGVAFFFGTLWFVMQMQCELWYALGACVFPFLPGEVVKIVLAVGLGSEIRKRLMRRNISKKR